MSTESAISPPSPPQATIARDVPYRGGGFVPHTNPWVGLAALSAVLLLWQGAAGLQADRLMLPSPAAVWSALVAMARSGELALNASASAQRLVLGGAPQVDGPAADLEKDFVKMPAIRGAGRRLRIRSEKLRPNFSTHRRTVS